MVWAPNVGVFYPWTTGGSITLPANGTANFLELDTNKDGVIDFADDPYLPYCTPPLNVDPGDEFVDWVGLSLYWYPDNSLAINNLPDPSYFNDFMTSTGPSVLRYNPIVNGQVIVNLCVGKPRFLQINSDSPLETNDARRNIRTLCTNLEGRIR